MWGNLDKEGDMEKAACIIMGNLKWQNGKMIFLFLSCDLHNIIVIRSLCRPNNAKKTKNSSK